MTTATLDQTSDRGGRELYRLSRLYDFPDFVKKADMETTLGPRDDSATTIFADPLGKRFPCDTRASTWLSSLWFEEKRAELSPKTAGRIEERLDRYIDYWRIRGDVEAMRTKRASLRKGADDDLPDSSFAFVWKDDETGLKERRLRLCNAREVKTAAAWLEKHRDAVPYGHRRLMAERILTKAAAFGASVTDQLDFLERQAGRGVCDPDALVSMVEDRAALCPTAPEKQAVLKIAETIRRRPQEILQPAMLIKLAETIDEIDRERLKLVGRYSDALPRPEDVIFAANFSKAASELRSACELVTGSIYDKCQFAKLALDDLQALFGGEFVNEVRRGLDLDVEKLASVLPTLPLPDAEIFEKLLLENGVRPKLRKAASVSVGFDHDQWAKLAEFYLG